VLSVARYLINDVKSRTLDDLRFVPPVRSSIWAIKGDTSGSNLKSRVQHRVTLQDGQGYLAKVRTGVRNKNRPPAAMSQTALSFPSSVGIPVGLKSEISGVTIQGARSGQGARGELEPQSLGAMQRLKWRGGENGQKALRITFWDIHRRIRALSTQANGLRAVTCSCSACS